MNNILNIFLSVILEGFPYIIIGSLLSAFLEVFIPETLIQKYAGKNSLKNIVLFALAGFVLPICECGIVPVAARLRKKGVKTGPMIAYLLSSPGFQPIVLFSTYFAFNNNFFIAFFRCTGSFFIAVIVAYLLRNDDIEKKIKKNNSCCNHSHHHIIDSKLIKFIKVFFNDGIIILSYLSIGALISALVSYYNPIDVYNNPIFSKYLAIPILMIMAVVLSVCSEADAFVAYSFAGFPLFSKMAFMWLGPVMDIKLAIMYSKVFNKKFTFKVFMLSSIVVFIFSYLFKWLY